MTTIIKRRGGTTQEHNSFTGASREITIDTDKKTIVVHDGVKVGGYPLAREDMSNVSNLNCFVGIFEEDGTLKAHAGQGDVDTQNYLDWFVITGNASLTLNENSHLILTI